MGRNKRHPVDKTRTKVWFAEASRAFDGMTAYEFWKKFDKKTGSLTKWSNYQSGKSVPKHLDGTGAVPMLVKEKPGTDAIFNALFWRVLKRDWPSETELIKEFRSLGGQFSVLPKLMLDGGFRDNKDVNGNIPLADVFDQLKEYCDGDFYSLQAVVLLLVWAKDAHSDYWDMCCDLYRELLPNFILEMDTPFKDEIFDHTDKLAGKLTADLSIPRETSLRVGVMKFQDFNPYFPIIIAAVSSHNENIYYFQKVHSQMNF
jgi:hypothetical protein